MEMARCADCHNPHASPQDKLLVAPGGGECTTCHDDKAPGENEVAHGIISHVNETAAALGCAVGQSVRECAERMLPAPVVTTEPPAISGGKRYLISENPGEPKVICLDAAPMLEDAT